MNVPVLHAVEGGGARAERVDTDIDERVDALRARRREVARHVETVRRVLRVGAVAAGLELADRRLAGRSLDLEVLVLLNVRGEACDRKRYVSMAWTDPENGTLSCFRERC